MEQSLPRRIAVQRWTLNERRQELTSLTRLRADLGRQLAPAGLVDNALKLLDPNGAPAREAELAALNGRIAQQWKPVLDAIQRRPAQ